MKKIIEEINLIGDLMDLDIIKNKLLVKYPFFGNVIANITIIESEEYVDFNGNPTLGTNGEQIFINPIFFNDLSVEDKVFVLAHEISHIAFDHISRGEGKERKIWNIATDAIINAQLVQDGLNLVKSGIYIPNAINYNAEELYELLLKDYNSYLSENDTPDLYGDDEIGHGTHKMWDNVNKNKKDNNIDETEIYEENRKQRKKLLEELKEELVQASLCAGKETNSETASYDNIGRSKKIIDWRLYLKEAIKQDVDWSYQNASIEDGVITPKLVDIPLPETEILLDTSCSVDDNVFKNFLRECKSILEASKVRVGCFDTKFYGFQDIQYEKDIDNMIFVGRGGTDFSVAINSFSDRVENKIIFTDGNDKIPNKFLDIIWVVYGETKINPKGGKVIYIDENGIKRLNKINMLKK